MRINGFGVCVWSKRKVALIKQIRAWCGRLLSTQKC